MKVKGVSENYQIIKYKKGVVTELMVKVEPTETMFKKGSLDKLKKQVEDEIYSILTIKIGAEIVKPGSLPRSEGKAKRVLDMTK